MIVLLVLAICLCLAFLPRLLPASAVVADQALPAIEPLASPAPPPPAPMPAPPMLAEQSSNLVYLPLGRHPADRCVNAPLVVAGVLRIRPPLEFWQISAGEIRFGDCARTPPGIESVSTGQRQVEAEEFRVVAGACVNSDLLVHGDLYLGRFSCVRGALQVDGGVWMDEGAEVAGAIIAHGSVRVGRRSRVAGPLMAGRSISLGRDCVIGSPAAPTTVNAATLRILEGCRVYGQVSAQKGAKVSPLASNPEARELV